MTGKYSNLPELKGFFDCTESDGPLFTDRVSGLIWNVIPDGYNFVFNTRSGGIGCTMPSTAPPVNFISGVSPTLDTNKCYLYLCSGRLTGSDNFRCSVGDINQLRPEYVGIGAGFGMADDHATIGSAAGTITVDGNPVFSIKSLGVIDITCVYRYDGTNNTLLFEVYDTLNGSLLKTTSNYVFHATIGDITPNPCFRYSGVELYGVQLWEFSVFPADVVTGALWMGKEWAKGRANRTLYPAWAGKSAGDGFSI